MATDTSCPDCRRRAVKQINYVSWAGHMPVAWNCHALCMQLNLDQELCLQTCGIGLRVYLYPQDISRQSE